MGFNYSKRVNLGNGVGLNVSKSGVSSSYRGKYGSIGSRGFSIKTGIPGLSFRGGWGGSRSRNGNEAIIKFVVWVILAGFVLGLIVAWNVARLIGWLTVETYHFVLRQIEKRRIQKEASLYKASNNLLDQ